MMKNFPFTHDMISFLSINRFALAMCQKKDFFLHLRVFDHMLRKCSSI